MAISIRKLLPVSLFALSASGIQQSNRQDDGYVGYRLDHRGEPGSANYETANTKTNADDTPLPDPDVYLNASVSVGEISLAVDNITAKVNLQADVLNLLHFSAGVDASIDRVKLTIQDVRAKVELEARLDNLAQMIDDALGAIDLNPVIATLGNSVSNVVDSAASSLGEGGLGSGVLGSDGLASNVLGSTGSGSAGSSGAAIKDPKSATKRTFQLHDGILYSVNDFSGNTHTNRVLAQSGDLYDVKLDNDGSEKSRTKSGYYSQDMTFDGHNRTISIAGQVKEFELQYIYTPFPGIESICWIYVTPAGKVTRTQVIAETFGGGSSTVGDEEYHDEFEIFEPLIGHKKGAIEVIDFIRELDEYLCISYQHKIIEDLQSSPPISDVDRNEKFNNILLETKKSNMAKSNYHPAFYPQILELFRRIRLPSEVVREDLMSPYDHTMERRIRMAISKVGIDDAEFISVDSHFEEAEEAGDSEEVED
ncbi:hypothetical protein VPNG_00868 [Cytospora leucostoma]|uniref:SUN domain-containing protein n=1 Tax=Cytospora leucostoma TaxID=1230097 RepID=A0A423XN61_9PEZI|nr:hypothetical protein VPNG_00868 [Cytospora leucostoma]